jgi:hypothetical protein
MQQPHANSSSDTASIRLFESYQRGIWNAQVLRRHGPRSGLSSNSSAHFRKSKPSIWSINVYPVRSQYSNAQSGQGSRRWTNRAPATAIASQHAQVSIGAMRWKRLPLNTPAFAGRTNGLTTRWCCDVLLYREIACRSGSTPEACITSTALLTNKCHFSFSCGSTS